MIGVINSVETEISRFITGTTIGSGSSISSVAAIVAAECDTPGVDTCASHFASYTCSFCRCTNQYFA